MAKFGSASFEIMIWGKILRVSAFTVLLGSVGCLPEVEYPDEPVVDFLSFDVDLPEMQY